MTLRNWTWCVALFFVLCYLTTNNKEAYVCQVLFGTKKAFCRNFKLVNICSVFLSLNPGSLCPHIESRVTYILLFSGRNSQLGLGRPIFEAYRPCTQLNTHTHTRARGGTPLKGRVARRRGRYLHNKHKR